jgi:hypothetical protein
MIPPPNLMATLPVIVEFTRVRAPPSARHSPPPEPPEVLLINNEDATETLVACKYFQNDGMVHGCTVCTSTGMLMKIPPPELPAQFAPDKD